MLDRIVFIVGSPGSGKTTVAKALAAAAGVTLIDSDSSEVAAYAARHGVAISGAVYELAMIARRCVATTVSVPLRLQQSRGVRIAYIRDCIERAHEQRPEAYPYLAGANAAHWASYGAYNIWSRPTDVASKMALLQWFSGDIDIPRAFLLDNDEGIRH